MLLEALDAELNRVAALEAERTGKPRNTYHIAIEASPTESTEDDPLSVCPKCERRYLAGTSRFCQFDGTKLEAMEPSS